MTTTLRLVIAEERTLFRQGLAALLQTESDLQVVGTAGDAEETRRACLHESPDLLLLHAGLSPGESEPSLLAILRVCCPQVAIVAYGEGAGCAETERRRMLDQGAAAYVGTTVEKTVLLQTLRTVAAARRCSDSEQESTENEGATGEPGHGSGKLAVTERERAVIALIAQGLCNKEIAQRLGISTQTVKNHVSHLLEKLDFADRTQLAVYAVEHHFQW